MSAFRKITQTKFPALPIVARSTALGLILPLAVTLALATFSSAAFAVEVLEQVEFDGETITISENEDFEKVISIGERELGKNFFAGFDRVTEIQGVPVALFYLGDGGNACGPSTLIIWRDDAGEIQTLDHDEGCSTPAPTIGDNGITFVPYLNPGDERIVWSWSPFDGMRTVGRLIYAAEPGTTWETLEASEVSHPLDFFQNESVLTQAAEILGEDLNQYVQGLRVASEPQQLQSGIVTASGCIPHNCGGGDSFLAVDSASQKLFMAQQHEGEFRFWPPAESWPAPAMEAFEIFRAQR